MLWNMWSTGTERGGGNGSSALGLGGISAFDTSDSRALKERGQWDGDILQRVGLLRDSVLNLLYPCCWEPPAAFATTVVKQWGCASPQFTPAASAYLTRRSQPPQKRGNALGVAINEEFTPCFCSEVDFSDAFIFSDFLSFLHLNISYFHSSVIPESHQ